jgi:hypothetical protein
VGTACIDLFLTSVAAVVPLFVGKSTLLVGTVVVAFIEGDAVTSWASDESVVAETHWT